MLLNNSTFKGILLLGLQLGLKQQDVVKSGTKLKKKMAKFVSLQFIKSLGKRVKETD
jgi:hypothetical protein